jgi:hypothetical protein
LASGQLQILCELLYMCSSTFSDFHLHIQMLAKSSIGVQRKQSALKVPGSCLWSPFTGHRPSLLPTSNGLCCPLSLIQAVSKTIYAFPNNFWRDLLTR